MGRDVISRHAVALVGGAGLIVMTALAAGCGHNVQQPPQTTTTTTTTTHTATPPESPTEKDLQPGGGNLFTPGDKAPPAATVAPGQHPGINGVP